jgi:hypothetical protein
MAEFFSRGLQQPTLASTQFAIGPQDAAELKKLYEELPFAAMRAADALRTNGIPLEGPALQRFRDEEANVAEIIRRIQQILHSTGRS